MLFNWVVVAIGLLLELGCCCIWVVVAISYPYSSHCHGRFRVSSVGVEGNGDIRCKTEVKL